MRIPQIAQHGSQAEKHSLLIGDFSSNNEVVHLLKFLLRITNLRINSNKEEIQYSYKLHKCCDVAEGIAYLYSHRVVHRDIRPENILMRVVAPELTDLVRMDGHQRPNEHFSLITGTEKRARPRSAPRFTLPKICFKYVEYHAKFVRPYLIGKRARTDPGDQECLLLDTRTACNLNRNQITKMLKSFIRPKDPELGAKITTMDVRSSFATIKLMEYKDAVSKGETNQSREVFMESLGNVMNTSVDMLNSVYFSIDDSDYLVAATNVYRFVKREQGVDQEYY